MKIFDAHCDLLLKLYENKNANFVETVDHVDVSLSRLKAGGVKVQVFAIFIPTTVHPSMSFYAALAQVDLFFEYVIKQGGLKHILTKSDIDNLKEDEIGAILALEGCDCIGNDLLKLKTLIHLGVRSVGLTWNHANLVADGILEKRGGGLTNFGESVVQLLNEHRLWCDVSHLSVHGFWDVMKLADFPVATHSNSKQFSSHRRNLTDEQFKALKERNGVVGVTFVPPFIRNKRVTTIEDLIKHIKHFVKLDGGLNIGIGSDFDGTSEFPLNLTNPEELVNLKDALLQNFSRRTVENILFENFYRCVSF